MKKRGKFHRKVILGIELEGYTILTPQYVVSRKIARHRKGTGEKGERFTRDWSIGTEYNGRPFSTLREGFFLLKTGLRKYNTELYRSKKKSAHGRQIFLVGGWNDRFAGAHIHISLADRKLTLHEAKRIADYLHDHLPLVIAVAANSPVWADKITGFASNRVLKGSKKYFRPIARRGLSSREFDEMTFSRERASKPATLEIRVMDSNIPEFVITSACIIKALVLAYLRRKKITNILTPYRYLRSRTEAARNGMNARLCWNDEWLSAPEYLDRFVWMYRKEIKEMDIPYEIWTSLKMLKKGVGGADMLRNASEKAYKVHPQTWERRFAKRYTRAIQQVLSG
jgi:gamma-glutamyl:cysteine ligase YbdK (ATP-grasp superfamily)